MAAPLAQVRDIDTLQAQQDSQLAVMMQIMGEDAPDGPLARNRVLMKHANDPRQEPRIVGLVNTLLKEDGEQILHSHRRHTQEEV